jgi:Ca-activated chloride channel family protein
MKTNYFNLLKKAGWSLALLGLTTLIACSQSTTIDSGDESTDKTLSPYFIVLSDNEDGAEQLPLKSTQVNVNIAGVIADVNVKQVYSNTGNKPIEAIYVFPASTRAAVHSMVMKVDDREIIAIVQEKEQARQTYETAKKQGKTASLLEEHRPNVFQMNVANIMPGANVEVRLSYTELLVPTDKVYKFIYPTVAGPRYVSGDEVENGTAENWTSNPYLEEGIKPTSTLHILLKVVAGMPIKDIRCKTHKHNVTYLDKSTAQINLNEPDGGNRDFVTEYRLAGDKIESGILLYEDPKGEKYFLAMMQPPKRIENKMIPNREYVFIVDVSGSMSGFPLDVSKELMKNLLKGLKSTDRFNIVFFAGGSNVYSEESLPATEKNINDAVNYLSEMHGGGGTELLNALKTAMRLNADDSFSRSFVILTDGYVSVEKQTFDYIRENLGNANFFSFGIGSSVNRHLIEGMAHVGYGEPFVALSKAEATTLAAKFKKYVSTPVLTNIEFEFKNFEAYDVIPEKVPDLFAERPLIISGKFKGQTTGSIAIKGHTGGEAYSHTMHVNNNVAPNTALKYLWAREKIRLLADYSNIMHDNETKNEIIALGLTYNLLTEYTSFVAVDSEISNSTGSQTTVKQPLPLPQGVTNMAVGAAAYKTMAPVHRLKRADKLETMELIVFEEEEEILEDEVFVTVEEMPKFMGNSDLKEFLDWIQLQIVYPEVARKKGISGRVFVKFDIDEKGNLVNIKIVRGIDPLLDNEVIRILKQSPTWTPGKQRGRNVKVTFTVPVVFKLPN